MKLAKFFSWWKFTSIYSILICTLWCSVQVGGKASGRIGTAEPPTADNNRRGAIEGEPSTSAGVTLSPSKQPVPPGWTGAEVTYFGLLRPIFGHNYCTIAELLRTKTCQEVYSYSQQVLGDSSLGLWEGPKRLTAKKKKRNMRYVYVHGHVYVCPGFCFFFSSSWLTNVDGMNNLWCSSTVWLLSTQI